MSKTCKKIKQCLIIRIYRTSTNSENYVYYFTNISFPPSQQSQLATSSNVKQK